MNTLTALIDAALNSNRRKDIEIEHTTLKDIFSVEVWHYARGPEPAMNVSSSDSHRVFMLRDITLEQLQQIGCPISRGRYRLKGEVWEEVVESANEPRRRKSRPTVSQAEPVVSPEPANDQADLFASA